MNIELPIVVGLALWFIAAYFIFLKPQTKAFNVQSLRSDEEVISGFTRVVVNIVFEDRDRHEASPELLADVVYRFSDLRKGAGLLGAGSREGGAAMLGEVVAGSGFKVDDVGEVGGSNRIQVAGQTMLGDGVAGFGFRVNDVGEEGDGSREVGEPGGQEMIFGEMVAGGKAQVAGSMMLGDGVAGFGFKVDDVGEVGRVGKVEGLAMFSDEEIELEVGDGDAATRVVKMKIVDTETLIFEMDPLRESSNNEQ